MFKQVQFRGVSESGQINCLPLLGASPSAALEKTAQEHSLASSKLHPTIRKFIKGVTSSPKGIYVLVSALGAGEYWGSNVNGDLFPEEALIHSPPDWEGLSVDQMREVGKKWDYGFPTFMNAYPYKHHQNKNSSRAFGEVVLAVWNPKMHRVELVVYLDRAKCKKWGAYDVIERIERGEFPDVSMGCRVPYDVCFPAGTLVRTVGGYKPIEEVRDGDLVRTHTGDRGEVSTTFQREVEGYLRVKAAGIPDIQTTHNHPFYVLRKEMVHSCLGSADGQSLRHKPVEDSCDRCKKDLLWEPEWATAENLQIGDYLMSPIHSRVTVGSSVGTPRARLLGYYLGNGHIIRQRIGKQKKGVYRDLGFAITVRKDDESHLQRLLGAMVESDLKNEPEVYDSGIGRNAHVVSVYDQKMASWLQHQGGRTSSGKRLNEEVFDWPYEERLEVLGGYIDADGSCDDRGQVRIPAINRGLALDTQRLCHSLEIPASVSFAGTSSGYGEPKPLWCVVIPVSHTTKLTSYSEKVPIIDKGWSSSQSFFWGGYWCTPVKSIAEADEPLEVFNISVKGDESYIVEGVAVHNCTICGHESKTRKDYCEHASMMMNKIMPDGRKVAVRNDRPKFFDISFVFIGADKSAKVLAKLAHKGNQVCMGDYCTVPRLSVDVGESYTPMEVREKLASEDWEDAFTTRLQKTALHAGSCSCDGLCDPCGGSFEKFAEAIFPGVQQKSASHSKLSELIKDVPAGPFFEKDLPVVEKVEASLPRHVLDHLAKHPLEDALAAPSALGMVLKPREFQRIILIQIGERPLANQLDTMGGVFGHTDEVDPLEMSPMGRVGEALKQLLLPFFMARSCATPILKRRILIATKLKPRASSPVPISGDEVMDKIAALYNGYRQDLAKKAAVVENQLVTDPQLLHGIAGGSIAQAFGGGFGKTASSASVFGPESLAYLSGAHYSDRDFHYKALTQSGASAVV